MNKKDLNILSAQLFNKKKEIVLRHRLYQFNSNSLVVEFNPSHQSKQDGDSIVLTNSMRSIGWDIDILITGLFTKAFLSLSEVSDLDKCSILDLSFSSGLFAILSERLGADKVGAYVHDIKTIRKNFVSNDSKALPLNKNCIHELGPYDLIFYDFKSLPSGQFVRKCASLVSPGKLLFITGLLGEQLPKIVKKMELDDCSLIYGGWVNETVYAAFKKK